MWAALCCIPYGETMSYGELAQPPMPPGQYCRRAACGLPWRGGHPLWPGHGVAGLAGPAIAAGFSSGAGVAAGAAIGQPAR
ncbi:hypothetical protein [Aquitalea magnusonii]|uniref:hypothetical protein n=1 Tax=Aquitalea magnusonii TaxID=332411 RepID=UPI003B8A81B7